MEHMIESVSAGSAADTLGIAKGDRLLAVNGKRIRDVFDYRFHTQSEIVKIKVMKPDGKKRAFKIVKDEYDDIGLRFKTFLMDGQKSCLNKCVFCFIDQLPPKMRGSLYFKDDDPRLSFFFGNYATLTNISVREAKRLAGYHLSPMRISLHAADPGTRAFMTGSKNAANVKKIMRIFNRAGISMHFQIVLCKGINDGSVLDDTLRSLLTCLPGAKSASVVPAGLTGHRGGLHFIEPHSRDDLIKAIKQVEKWQRFFKKRTGSSFVYASDEIYLSAGIRIPDYVHYEDFPQFENGVGMIAAFKFQFLAAHKKSAVAAGPFQKIGIVTGESAAPFIFGLAAKFIAKHSGSFINVYMVKNNFFGGNVTVSGLLTGADITAQLSDRLAADKINRLFVPRNAFNSDGDLMLDGTTADDLGKSLGVEIIVGDSDGGAFYNQLLDCVKAK